MVAGNAHGVACLGLCINACASAVTALVIWAQGWCLGERHLCHVLSADVNSLAVSVRPSTTSP